MKILAVQTITAAALLSASAAHAIEITMDRGNARSTIIVSGEIEPGDAKRFQDYWDQNANDSFGFKVAFDSPGGSLIDGIELGRFLRRVDADTEVQRFKPSESEFTPPYSIEGGICYSACALAFMGGVERDIPEGGSIGFHQFFGGGERSTAEAMESTQLISALISTYLRDMGGKPELFEQMASTSPSNMFVPDRDESIALGIIPSKTFSEFRLIPKDDLIVAVASNDRNPGSLERVHDIETLCWKNKAIVNLYAVDADQGLDQTQADLRTTHIDGFQLDTPSGTIDYGKSSIRLYPRSRLLASLILDARGAKALSSGDTLVRVNSYTASGVFMTGMIETPPGGDPAIRASLRACLRGD